LLVAEITPSVPAAIDATLQAAAKGLTVPLKTHHTLVVGINLDMHQAPHLFLGQLGLDLGDDDRVLNEGHACLRSESESPAWDTIVAGRAPMMKPAVVSCCSFFSGDAEGSGRPSWSE